jgi:ABC-type transport system involved in multi-copper enzyme maturation permease subunit
MIRLSLLQFRIQALIAIAALAIVAVILLITGPHLVYLYDTTVAACKAPADCSSVNRDFVANDNVLQIVVGTLLLLAPALIGIFWGAPLIARELESGTYRLAWTQSVTRTRWLAVKLGLAGLAGVAVGGLLSLLVTWWFSPIDTVNANRFTPGVFDERDVVAIGYAAFAFALGVTAGLLIRRVLPAMAATLVVFAAARLATLYLVRPYLIAPVKAGMALSSASGLGFGPSASGETFQADPPTIRSALVISSQVVDSAGQVATDQRLHQFLVSACPNIVAPVVAPTANATREPANQATFQDCITHLSNQFHLAVTYQPANRYWTFQWYETAIFVGVALVLAGFCFWWIRNRLS